MTYDLEAMDFDIKAARKGDLWNAFIWKSAPEGGFWVGAFFGQTPRSEWQPKLDAMIAQWERKNGEDKMTLQIEEGTLAELDVKPGDVVELVKDFYDEVSGLRYLCRDDGELENMETGSIRGNNFLTGKDSHVEHVFRIISRADGTPRPLKDMTFVMECIDMVDELFDSNLARLAREELGIRPEPKRETVTLYGDGESEAWGRGKISQDTYAISFVKNDGKPDLDSIRMEEL